MKTPFFSRREVLAFLLNDARDIEAGTEDEIWRKVWRVFFPFADELRDDGLFLEFQRCAQFYGFGPMQNRGHTWTMTNVNLERVTA